MALIYFDEVISLNRYTFFFEINIEKLYCNCSHTKCLLYYKLFVHYIFTLSLFVLRQYKYYSMIFLSQECPYCLGIILLCT